jgi:hypothetical protein
MDSASTLSMPQSLLIQGGGATDVDIFLVAGGAKGRSRPWRRSEDQPPSGWGSAAPPSRRRIEVEQPLSWRAPSALPPSRARRAARRRNPGCAPRCKLSSFEPLSRILQLVLFVKLDSIFS